MILSGITKEHYSFIMGPEKLMVQYPMVILSHEAQQLVKFIKVEIASFQEYFVHKGWFILDSLNEGFSHW